jgi:hypothetical protein
MPRPKKSPIAAPISPIAPAPRVLGGPRAPKPEPKVEYPIPVQEPDTTLKAAPVVTRGPRSKQRLPDPFEELSEKTRSYLRLEGYGDNIIIDKKLARGLLKVFENIKNMPLPETVAKELTIHHDLLRKFLGYITIAESEEPWRAILKEHFEPTYPNYKCKCAGTKRRVSKGTKPAKTEDDDD